MIQPPVQDFYDTDIRLQPLGLAYLKAIARKFLPEIEVKVCDFHQGYPKKTISLPKEFSYLRHYWQLPDKSPFAGFFHYYHFGADFETIAEYVHREKPDLVGISSLFSPYYREVIATARAIRQKTKVPILLGGSHVSAMPEFMLRFEEIDYVIVGEGEKPFVEFLRYFFYGKAIEEVPNLGYKRDGRIYFTRQEENYPLDIIPPPDFSDLRAHNYTLSGKKLAFVITSRSCPHRCSFCSVHTTFGMTYRRRKTSDVFAEIKALVEQGYKIIDFEDDNLTFYKKEFKELCYKLKDSFSNRDVSFVAMNGISYLSLDDEMLGLMKEARFTHLNLSLVSSNQTVLRTTKRPHTVAKYLQVVEQAWKLGFKIISYQILGLPFESLESMVQTLVFHARLPVLLGPSLFYLTPNSPLAHEMPAYHGIDPIYARGSAMAVETPYVNRRELYTLFLANRILNFLKGLNLTHMAKLSHVIVNPPSGKASLGLMLLQHFLAHGELLAYTDKGFIALKNYCAELLRNILEKTKYIRTRDGSYLYLDLREIRNSAIPFLEKKDIALEKNGRANLK